ncbi:MAG: hypothetical protein KGO96_09290 [Elusimicrobia bacterium]|nr:hypothetical protein [Elusimicrobiota bacterium]MDE2236699.1 hypothetical protein [Elusimicrobiota bacterium]MDE2426083.1 hypothetical protein [Elusimicrobiota bacterium]
MLAIAAFRAAPALAAGTADVSVSGSWSQTIGATALVSGPGSDLTASYVGGPSDIVLAVTINGNHSWNVNVRRVDSLWNQNLNLYVQRTSDGTAGSGQVSGGTAYQLVTASDQLFFSGTKSQSGFAVQVKLDGVSLQVPPADYSTTLTFTVVAL